MKLLFQINAVIFSFTAAVMFSGCSFFTSTEYVTFYLQGNTTVNYINIEGKPESIKAAGSFSCCVNKNKAVPFIAENGSGTIYPYDNNLTEKNAFSADLLYTMYLCSENGTEYTKEYLSKFNWKRFMEETYKFPEPFKLDKQRLMTAIANHSIRKSDFRIIE